MESLTALGYLSGILGNAKNDVERMNILRLPAVCQTLPSDPKECLTLAQTFTSYDGMADVMILLSNNLIKRLTGPEYVQWLTRLFTFGGGSADKVMAALVPYTSQLNIEDVIQIVRRAKKREVFVHLRMLLPDDISSDHVCTLLKACDADEEKVAILSRLFEWKRVPHDMASDPKIIVSILKTYDGTFSDSQIQNKMLQILLAHKGKCDDGLFSIVECFPQDYRSKSRLYAIQTCMRAGMNPDPTVLSLFPTQTNPKDTTLCNHERSIWEDAKEVLGLSDEQDKDDSKNEESMNDNL